MLKASFLKRSRRGLFIAEESFEFCKFFSNVFSNVFQTVFKLFREELTAGRIFKKCAIAKVAHFGDLGNFSVIFYFFLITEPSSYSSKLQNNVGYSPQNVRDRMSAIQKCARSRRSRTLISEHFLKVHFRKTPDSGRFGIQKSARSLSVAHVNSSLYLR